jgi:hypothetical protein
VPPDINIDDVLHDAITTASAPSLEADLVPGLTSAASPQSSLNSWGAISTRLTANALCSPIFPLSVGSHFFYSPMPDIEPPPKPLPYFQTHGQGIPVISDESRDIQRSGKHGRRLKWLAKKDYHLNDARHDEGYDGTVNLYVNEPMTLCNLTTVPQK